MFRTLSSDVDPRDIPDDAEKTYVKESAADSRSSASTISDDEIEREQSHDEIQVVGNEKRPGSPVSQVQSTTSKALSRVASRLTTKSLPDPGPAPGVVAGCAGMVSHCDYMGLDQLLWSVVLLRGKLCPVC